MLYFGIIAGIFTLDFWIKQYVDKKYSLKEKHLKFKNKIYIEKYYNHGAALNLLQKYPRVTRLLQTIMMVIVCVWYYISVKKSAKAIEKIGVACLLGGGLNNLYDRYTKGYVVDYLGFEFGPRWFRRIIFNISDFFVFIGAVMIVLQYRE